MYPVLFFYFIKLITIFEQIIINNTNIFPITITKLCGLNLKNKVSTMKYPIDC